MNGESDGSKDDGSGTLSDHDSTSESGLAVDTGVIPDPENPMTTTDMYEAEYESEEEAMVAAFHNDHHSDPPQAPYIKLGDLLVDVNNGLNNQSRVVMLHTNCYR